MVCQAFVAAAVLSAGGAGMRTIPRCARSAIAAGVRPRSRGHFQTRNGSAHWQAAPHGVYPCRGENRWIAIGVHNDGNEVAVALHRARRAFPEVHDVGGCVDHLIPGPARSQCPLFPASRRYRWSRAGRPPTGCVAIPTEVIAWATVSDTLFPFRLRAHALRVSDQRPPALSSSIFFRITS